MASIVHARITFTDLVEAAFAGTHVGLPVKVGLAGIRKVIEKKHLAAITRLRDKLSQGTQKQIGALLVLYKEQLAILDDIIESKKPAEAWAAEARVQAQADGSLKCKIDEFVENMGDDFPSSNMLVVTPLTRAARRAYVKALHSGNTLFFSGPAGTGKTETAKDISRMLGRNATVFNSTDTLTPDEVAAALAKIPEDIRTPIILDEFNRIPTKVQQQIRARIEDERPGQFVILTANPGYTGRVPIQLPGLQTLKFTVPAMDIIAQAMLGFQGIDCTASGQALVACFADCRAQCTKHPSYDYGMRALKSIATLAGNIARENGYVDEPGAVRTAVGRTLYCRATAKDKPVVLAAVKRAFGAALDVPTKYTGPCGIAHQVLDVSQVRHGVCINGVTDAKAIVQAVGKVSGTESTVIHVDPKNSITSVEGPLFAAMKAAGSKSSKEFVFLILPPAGGPVPIWDILESLNTLFDNNKKVLFDNGEYVSMSANQRFIVITEGCCSHFSPAHTSRLGMITVE